MIRWILLFGMALAGAASAQAVRDCATCPEMTTIPAGSFLMGPAAGEEEDIPERSRLGVPHRVTVDASFMIGKYEITRAEFAAFVSSTGRQTGNSCWIHDAFGRSVDRVGRSWRDPGFAQTDRDPVVCVSWDDARAYVSWLRQLTGKPYRLPSEAEWEYAARAGSQASRYWGESLDSACRFGNFADRTAVVALDWEDKPDVSFPCDDGFVHTAPVGTFRPNAFDVHDMLGNAWEWTEDCYTARYDGVPADGGSQRAGDCDVRVLRGGSWHSRPWFARSAFRINDPVVNRYYDLGFRVAKSN